MIHRGNLHCRKFTFSVCQLEGKCTLLHECSEKRVSGECWVEWEVDLNSNTQTTTPSVPICHTYHSHLVSWGLGATLIMLSKYCILQMMSPKHTSTMATSSTQLFCGSKEELFGRTISHIVLLFQSRSVVVLGSLLSHLSLSSTYYKQILVLVWETLTFSLQCNILGRPSSLGSTPNLWPLLNVIPVSYQLSISPVNKVVKGQKKIKLYNAMMGNLVS